MLKLMVVEDESVQLMNLVGMIQMLKPSYIIFSAKDGVQALSIMQSFPVDLLITDIKMPNMNGLDLIDEAKKRYPSLYTVILSGYGEFEYAQRAIELGVDAYMLKMPNKQKLVDIMNRLEEKVYHSKRDDGDVALLERKLESLSLGQNRISEENEILSSIGNFDTGLILCVKYLSKSWDEITVALWLRKLERITEKYGNSVSFRCHHRNGAPATVLHTSAKPDETFFRDLRDLCTEFEEKTFVLGVSDFFTQLNGHFSSAFHQATEACERSFYSPNETVYCFESLSVMQPFLPVYLRLPLETVFEQLKQNNLRQAADIMIQNAKQYIRENHPYPSRFKELLLFCVWKMCGDAKETIDNEKLQLLINSAEQQISGSVNIDELFNAINIIFEHICTMLADRRNNSTNIALENAAKLLKSDYAKDWTLELLAEQIHFNSTYLSSLFKQYFGMGFTEYLNDIRLSRAATLLRNTNTRVGVLAKQVGYQNSAYFIRLFRKKYGVTPNEYRRGYSE